MSAPFIVDEAFKRKISYLKVTELHTLLRNLGVSYQANKDQLVKRLIVKYSQIYEQYSKGLVPYDEAKRYGDWINDGNIVYVPPPPPVTPPKVQSSPSTSITRTKPIIINVPHTQSSYGGDLSSYQSAGTQYNNNNYYNYNMYAQSSNAVNGYYSNNNGVNSTLSKPTSSYGPSGSTKTTSIDVSYKSPTELVFPKSLDPFLEIEATLASTRLKTYAESRGRPTSVSFVVPESHLSSVRAGTSRMIVRSFEVSNTLSHVSPPHAWPPDCTLSVNGTYMALGIKKQTKPNAPPHPDKPLDISKECRSGRNTMEVTTSSSRHYAVVVDVMRVISVDTLVDVVTKNKTMNFESAKKTISLALGGDDKDIAALHTTVSLQCPLGRTPLVLPAKSSSCRHIQCFDLRNYLMMNQRTPSWKCPVCSTVANTSNLVIDAYFTELLRTVDSSNVSEVHIDPSGNWSTVKPRKTATPKIEPTSPAVRAINVSSPPTPSPQKPKRVVEVVDLLSDDDDDVISIPSAKRAKPDLVKPPYVPNPVVSSAPPSPPLPSSIPFPPTSTTIVETTTTTTTTTIAYPIIASPPPSPSTTPVPTSPILTLNEPYSPPSPLTPTTHRNSTSATFMPAANDIQPSEPPATSPIDNPSPPLPTTEEDSLEENLHSDLASPNNNPPATSDTPDPKRKGLIVKLSLKQKPIPPPPSSTSLSPQSTLTSPTPPTPPPPPSVPSESSDSLSSLEVPNLADPFSSSGNSTGRYAANHYYPSNSSPGEYGPHWPHQNYRPPATTHSPTTYPYPHHDDQYTNYHESYDNTDPPHDHHHDCHCEDCDSYANHYNNSHEYYDNYNYTNHNEHSDHDYHTSHAHYSNHNYRPSHPRHYNYNQYDPAYNASHYDPTYHNNHPNNNGNHYLPDTDHHRHTPTHSHPSSYYNGYFDADDEYPNINPYPLTVTSPSHPYPHALSPPQPSTTPSSSHTISTTTTTTTTTTTHGTTTMHASSSFHSNGSLSQPVIVLSDDDDDGGNFL